MGYVIGSVNAAIIISKQIIKTDVRTKGSGNAGAANVTRVFGIWAGLGTLAFDMLKMMLSMWLGAKLFGETGMAIAATSCIIGHCFPLFFAFKGGKAVAVSAGIALYMDYRLILALLAVYVTAFLLFKMASVASISAVTFMPVAMALIGGFSPIRYAIAAVAVIAVWVMHRSNIKRIIKKEEKRFEIKSKR